MSGRVAGKAIRAALQVHSPAGLFITSAYIPGITYDEVCESPDLSVLEYHGSVVRDDQDPVVRYRFFTSGCPNDQIVGFQADIGT
jgi:hypothetical protein